MFSTYMGNGKMFVKTKNGFALFVPSDDLSITPALMLNGCFEPALAHYLIQNVKKGQTVVDVGANVGYFTIILGLLVGEEGKVVAYEANPNVFNFLRDNTIINNTNPQTLVLNKGVYSKEDNIKFYITKNLNINSSIYERNKEYCEVYHDEYEIINIPTESLDERFASEQYIDLVKIDIEGGELEAFKGMKFLLQQQKVGTIIFEWNKIVLQEKTDEFLDVLNDSMKLSGKNLYSIQHNSAQLIPADINKLKDIGWHPYLVLK